MDLFTRTKPPDPPLSGLTYISTLHKYLRTNLPRLAPSAPPAPTVLQQSYTLLTLGLDPSSQPLHRSIKVPLTLGFGSPSAPKGPIRPLTLRLPPDRLLYLLLRWQELPQNLSHVGRTDVPIEEGVPFVARGAAEREGKGVDGDVQSVRSWVGSMRSVSMGSMSMGMGSLGKGWWGKEEPNEDQILLALYSMFNVLPALLIHPPFVSDPPIAELIEAGGYTQFGGVDVRVPLDVLRNLQVLELEGYDPRALLIPPNPNLRSLTVRDVQDGDDWIEELLLVTSSSKDTSTSAQPQSRFPTLRHLSLPSTSLLSLPSLPLTNLHSLDLSHNLLNAIPSALSSLPSLTSLNLSYNLITSVRNAPQSLSGPISTLNISHNRIDCLVGLDRIPTLQRVDLRHNDLGEVGEVGRLAVLPRIKEVWVAGNEFTSATAVVVGDVEWRVALGVMFAQEGREGVVVDDTPFSWVENRSIEGLLVASGGSRGARTGGHAREPTAPAGPGSNPGSVRRMINGNGDSSSTKTQLPTSQSDQTSDAGPSKPRNPMTTSTSTSAPQSPLPNPNANPTVPPSPAPSSSTATTTAAIGKKRRPRRLINLDSTDDAVELKGGSMRLPKKSVLYEDEHEAESGDGAVVPDGSKDGGGGGGAASALEGKVDIGIGGLKKGRRGRVSASMFEP